MHINYVAVVIAALVQWLLGIFWYLVVFKKSWRKLIGIAEGEKPKNSIFALIAGFIACLLLSFIMGHLFAVAHVQHFIDGASLGGACWIGFMAPVLFAEHILEGRRANLFVINAAYWLVAMILGCAILAGAH